MNKRNRMRQCLTVHIGMPKTASTTLQAALFSRHPQVQYLGKYAAGMQAPDSEKDRSLRRAAGNQPGRRESAELFRELCLPCVEAAYSEGRVPLWSQEALAGGSLEQRQQTAQLFKTVFGPCRIILFTRELLSFTQSFYFQKLRAYNQRSGWNPAWSRHLAPPPNCFAIDEWLTAVWETPQTKFHGHLRYGETAQVFAAAFGGANIKILTYESLVQRPRETLCELAEFIGIDADEAVALMAGQNRNTRWSEAHLLQLKRLQRRPLKRWRFRFSSSRQRRQMLRPADPRSEADKPKAVMSDRWRREIQTIAATQDALLRAVTGDLAGRPGESP